MGLCYTGLVEDEPLVTAQVVSRELGIPRSTLYRLVEAGKVPAVDVTKDWHERRQYRFRLSEVRTALADIRDHRKN